MTTLSQATKKYFGTPINHLSQYAKFYIRRCIQNEQTVYSIMQLTNLPERAIISFVQDNPISYEETLKYALIYRELPTFNECVEIYLMGGFDNWFNIERHIR